MIKNIGIAIALLLMMACSNDNESKLFGKWQMTASEYEGQTTKVDTVFYNFQHELFEYQIIDPNPNINRYRYGHCKMLEHNELLLSLVNDPGSVESFLPYTDWTSDKRTFTIEKLTGSALILTSEGKRYYFRKF